MLIQLYIKKLLLFFKNMFYIIFFLINILYNTLITNIYSLIINNKK